MASKGWRKFFWYKTSMCIVQNWLIQTWVHWCSKISCFFLLFVFKQQLLFSVNICSVTVLKTLYRYTLFILYCHPFCHYIIQKSRCLSVFIKFLCNEMWLFLLIISIFLLFLPLIEKFLYYCLQHMAFKNYWNTYLFL